MGWDAIEYCCRRLRWARDDWKRDDEFGGDRRRAARECVALELGGGVRAAGGSGDGSDGADVVSGKCVGTRFSVSHGVVARRLRAVARRDFVSTVGGVGELRIWRAAIYFLSAAFLDCSARRWDWCCRGRWCRARFDLDCFGAGRMRHVAAGAGVAAGCSGGRGGAALRSESLSI